MSARRVRRVGSLLVALGLLSVAPFALETARADNLGGVFERCAQLVEFVPPSTTEEGQLTLVGIGPGLYNAVDDTTHHRFPLSPNMAMSESLQAELRALADGLSFTCLRMRADGGPPSVVTEIAISRQARVCGVVSRDALGVYVLDGPNYGEHAELLADAQEVVGSDFYLGHLLDAASGSDACIDVQLDQAGVVEAMTADVSLTSCGTLFEGATMLVVGKLLLEDSNSGTTDLLPAKTTAAGYLLARAGANGCVAAEIQRSQILSAALTADGSICGFVVGSEGGTTLDGLTIAGVLNDVQSAALDAAIGGTACLSIAIEGNQVTAELSTTPPTPAPTPAPTPTPSPSLTPVATTSPTDSSTGPSPSAQPGGIVTPTGGGGSPVAPVILPVMAAAAAGAIGFIFVRRYRKAAPVPPGSAPIAEAAYDADLTAPAVAVQPNVVTLTRREQEVLGMLYEGLSNKEIGARLFITESTAGVHISNIMTKLGARSRAEAAALAHRMGLMAGDARQH